MWVLKVCKACLLEAFMVSVDQALSKGESWKDGGGNVTLKAVITDSWYGDKKILDILIRKLLACSTPKGHST